MKIKNIFISLSIGLTFISLFAGFTLYQSLFGIGLAILISCIFEVLRLSSLYSFKQFKGIFKAITILLYILIAGTCFTASVLSFNSKIIENEDKYKESIKTQMIADIHTIKESYSKKIDNDIAILEESKNKLEILQSKYPSKTDYQLKIAQRIEKINELNNKREEFFESVKETPEWISNQKAILGIAETNEYKNLKSPIARASQESLGFDENQLQKVFGFVLTLIIEMGIVLLGVLGIASKKDEEINLDSPKEESVEKKKRGRSIIPKR